MRLLEVALQVMSVSVIGSLAVAKGSSLLTSVVQRAVVVTAAVLCFMASRWLATYIERTSIFRISFTLTTELYTYYNLGEVMDVLELFVADYKLC
jgi:hypothetical protein